MVECRSILFVRRCRKYLSLISQNPSSNTERRAVVSLASIYMIRMLGLFMILPVFSIYAVDLEGSQATLIGVAIGIYGLGQALFQLPYGLLSDRFGRKPLIMSGLFLFALGAVIAAMSTSIYGVIIGRALQGSGAVAAVTMALLADLTKEENRTKAMAAVGMSIGIAFALALVLGPLLATYMGLQGLFWLTAGLALIAMYICWFVVPNPQVQVHQEGALPVKSQLRDVLLNPELARLNIGIFVLHSVLTASFVVLPLALVEYGHFSLEKHWQVYLPVLLGSFIAMLPLMILAEKKNQVKNVFLFCLIMLMIGMVGLGFGYQNFSALVFFLLVFFFGFNLLEALLPSLISKIAPANNKGSAMGVYSTAQFLGVFVGGSLGGFIYGAAGIGAVFLSLAGLTVIWFFISLGMKNPKKLKSYKLSLANVKEARVREIIKMLESFEGVEEVLFASEEDAAYLKVDHNTFDDTVLREFSQG